MLLNLHFSSNNSLEYVLDSKVVNYSIPSDHSAIQLKLKVSTKKKMILKNIDSIDWTLFLDNDINETYNSSLKNKVKDLRFNNNNFKLNYETFSKFIVTSAKESATIPLKMNSGWYNLSSDIIKPLMDERSRNLDLIRQKNFDVKTAKSMARTVKKNLQDGIELAKSRWSNHLAERIHSMSHFPKDAWSAVNKLKDWIQGHHVTPNIMKFKKEDETYTETDEEKLEMLSTHFEKVFNSEVNIDWSILLEISPA